MIYGNLPAKEILEKIEDKIKNGKLKSGFFLLSGPSNIGKKTLVLELINNLGALPQDTLIIEDPGKIDGKLYQIKIEVPEKEQVLLINDKKFLNYGARQIQEFLSTTSFGNYKILFIENIERLNISAANALLKTFEEPGENVFIFATTSNKNKILSTILSRAFLINLYPLTYSEFINFLNDNFPNLSDSQKQILYSISGGRIGLAKNLLTLKTNVLNLIEVLEEFLQLENTENSLFGRFSIIKDLIQNNEIYNFLDALIFFYTHNHKYEKVKKLIFIKQAIVSNVNVENLFFDYLLN